MGNIKWLMRITGWLIGILVMIGLMGGSCDGLSVVFPGGGISFNTVTIKLVNTTAYPVDPLLYVDPDEDFLFNIITADENFVLIDPPIEPGEIVTLTFGCEEIGSATTDYALLLLSDSEAVESDNAPVVYEEDHFECGDVISFIFIDEVGGEFFTRVEVNDHFVMD